MSVNPAVGSGAVPVCAVGQFDVCSWGWGSWLGTRVGRARPQGAWRRMEKDIGLSDEWSVDGLDGLGEWSVEEELRLPEWKATRETLSKLTRHQRYLELRCGAVQVELRWSIVPRRGLGGPLDVDIVKIAVDAGQRRRGIGTRFCITLAVLVFRLLGKGLYLEQCITPSSHGLALRLLRMGWFYHPLKSEPSVLAHFPPARHVPLSAGAIAFTPKPRAHFEQCDVCDGPVRPPGPCMSCAAQGADAPPACARGGSWRASKP